MEYPHTTSILKPWANYEWVTEEDLQRGSKRHAAYAAHLVGVWAPPVDPRDQGQLDSFRRWVEKYVVKVWCVEKVLVDPDNLYQGTIDFLGELTICPGACLDWKPPSAGGPVVRAQCASYLNLAQKNKYAAKKAGYLKMDPDGGTAKMEWIESAATDFLAFIHALNCTRYFGGR